MQWTFIEYLQNAGVVLGIGNTMVDDTNTGSLTLTKRLCQQRLFHEHNIL